MKKSKIMTLLTALEMGKEVQINGLDHCLIDGELCHKLLVWLPGSDLEGPPDEVRWSYSDMTFNDLAHFADTLSDDVQFLMNAENAMTRMKVRKCL